MIQIRNLTFSYNPREDRIFILVNHNNFNNRIDFIVTRKKLIELLNGFDEILINHCNNGELFKQLYTTQEPLKKEEIQTPQNKNQLNLNKNKWEKNVNPKDLHLTKNKKPIMLDALSFNIKDSQLIFKFISNNTFYAISIMDKEMFQKTLSSMMRVVPFVSWGISPHILD